MGRGQGKRTPLKLVSLEVPVVVSPYEVLDVARVGRVGMRVVMKKQKITSTLQLMPLDLFDGSGVFFIPDSYYVADNYSTRREVVTGEFCTCGVFECSHLQAVRAAREVVARDLSVQGGWGDGSKPISARVLASGVGWVREVEQLSAYALRLGDNQGLLAFNVWAEYSMLGWSEFEKVHSLAGVCKSCNTVCVEGQLLARLLVNSLSIWDASLLATAQVRTNVQDEVLRIEKGFGEGFSYKVKGHSWRDTDGQSTRQYNIYARLSGVLVTSVEEEVRAGKVVSGRCVGQVCTHAPWRELYEGCVNNPLARLRRRLSPKPRRRSR